MTICWALSAAWFAQETIMLIHVSDSQVISQQVTPAPCTQRSMLIATSTQGQPWTLFRSYTSGKLPYQQDFLDCIHCLICPAGWDAYNLIRGSSGITAVCENESPFFVTKKKKNICTYMYLSFDCLHKIISIFLGLVCHVVRIGEVTGLLQFWASNSKA